MPLLEALERVRHALHEMNRPAAAWLRISEGGQRVDLEDLRFRLEQSIEQRLREILAVSPPFGPVQKLRPG